MEDEHIITLKAMRFHARIGVLPHEAEFAQPLEIDLSVWTSRHVIDYSALYKVVVDIVSRGHIRYLEDLIESVAGDVFTIEAVTRVAVSARKPNVALPGPLGYAEVSLDRVRR